MCAAPRAFISLLVKYIFTREKHPLIDKQSQIAEQKTVGEQGPGNRSKEAA